MLSNAEQQLIAAGSVEALARTIGAELASEALYSLSLRAPEELRGVWYQVIAWGRFQQAYEIAEKLADSDAMIRAIKAQTDLVERLYK